jgi:hypothetical protein
MDCQIVLTWRSRADWERFRQSAGARNLFSGEGTTMLAREPRVTVWEAEEENDG